MWGGKAAAHVKPVSVVCGVRKLPPAPASPIPRKLQLAKCGATGRRQALGLVFAGPSLLCLGWLVSHAGVPAKCAVLSVEGSLQEKTECQGVTGTQRPCSPQNLLVISTVLHTLQSSHLLHGCCSRYPAALVSCFSSFGLLAGIQEESQCVCEQGKESLG